jgi:RNA polymerase sigma factor (sigma-70 family)
VPPEEEPDSHAGDRPDEFLEGHRAYLDLLVRMRLPPWLRQRLNPCEVVNQTVVNALLHRDQLKALPPDRLRAYLRRVLQNVVWDEARKFLREQKQVSVEQAVSSSFGLMIPDDGTSPSERAMREEALLELARALAQLSERERTAVELRYLRVPRCSLEQIGKELGCTERAAGGVLWRAMEKLRRLMPTSQ